MVMLVQISTKAFCVEENFDEKIFGIGNVYVFGVVHR